MKSLILFFFFILQSQTIFAGNQQYEMLKDETRQMMSKNISDFAPNISSFKNIEEEIYWISKKSNKISKYVKDQNSRIDLLKSVHYEAIRAGLEPEWVLGIIHVESGFNKYAVSSVGAIGYMQVMPFWIELIGDKSHNLFHLRTNLRYGCTILKHYLDIEKGNLVKALARYNGSIGQDKYPNLVFNKIQYYSE